MRTLQSAEGGVSMVEFAIVLPLFVLLVFGIIEFGRAYHTQLTLTHAAREGVREYALTQNPADGIATATAAAGILDPAQLSITTTACTVDDQTSLTVEYPFELLIPLRPASSLTLTGEAVMRCGG